MELINDYINGEMKFIKEFMCGINNIFVKFINKYYLLIIQNIKEK